MSYTRILLKCMAEGEGLTVVQLAERSGLSMKRTKACISSMRKSGHVSSVPIVTTYCIAPKGVARAAYEPKPAPSRWKPAREMSTTSRVLKTFIELGKPVTYDEIRFETGLDAASIYVMVRRLVHRGFLETLPRAKGEPLAMQATYAGRKHMDAAYVEPVALSADETVFSAVHSPKRQPNSVFAMGAMS